jgi:hypothetical protein
MPQADQVRVKRPAGDEALLVPKPGQPLVYEDTGAIGLYEVTQRQADQILATEQFAVNLTDEAESNIRPGPPPQTASATAEPGGPLVTVQREIWLWLGLAAAALLLGEWWLFHRGSG